MSLSLREPGLGMTRVGMQANIVVVLGRERRLVSRNNNIKLLKILETTQFLHR